MDSLRYDSDSHKKDYQISNTEVKQIKKDSEEDNKDYIPKEDMKIVMKNNDTNNQIKMQIHLKQNIKGEKFSPRSKNRPTDSIIGDGGYVKTNKKGIERSKKKSRCKRMLDSTALLTSLFIGLEQRYGIYALSFGFCLAILIILILLTLGGYWT